MDVLRFALTMLVASRVAVNLAIDWLQMAGPVCQLTQHRHTCVT